jgi:hypothetical protein
MPAKSKQAERSAQKRAAKKAEDEEPPPASGGNFGVEKIIELGKALVLGSCLVKFAPKMPDLLKPPSEKAAPENQEINKPEGNEETSNGEEKTNGEASEENSAQEEAVDASAIFAALSTRLEWCNSLGLGFPESGEEAMAKWLALKDLELDWGPRKARKGTPSQTRIMTNLCANMSQYLHVLLALMMLRAFLFRSWFACLPWLFGLQLASLLVPVELAPQVPMKFRAAGAIGIHALLWLFFLYEVVWRAWIFEKFLLVGLFAFHAHSVRPADA